MLLKLIVIPIVILGFPESGSAKMLNSPARDPTVKLLVEVVPRLNGMYRSS